MKFQSYVSHKFSLIFFLLILCGSFLQAQSLICATDTVLLDLSTFNGTVQWQESPDNATWTNISGATGNSISVYPSVRTFYRGEIIDGTCAPVYSEVGEVVPSIMPTISVTSGNPTMCMGDTVSLQSSMGVSYSWSTGDSSQSIMVTSSGNITVTVTDTNGCQVTSAATVVTTNPAPTADAGMDTSYPCSLSVTLGGSPTASGGVGPYTYQWWPSSSLSSDTAANPVANPGSATQYTVTVTDSIGCMGMDSVWVTPVGTGGASGTQTFSYTGSVQTFVVPGCVDSITIECWGAAGGSPTNNTCGNIGGLGGYAFGDYVASPGDTLWIYVGGEGQPGDVGGWNGGGQACTFTTTCSRGGGASDVRVSGQTLNDRVIVGGGGGGAEWSNCNGTGGSGGGLVGTNGTHTSQGGQRNGHGGTQTAGGIGGTSTNTYHGQPGTFGVGGTTGFHPSGHAGSGGGGWYGGGGSAEDGHGGGGSSYLGGVVGTTGTTAGVRTGAGQIILTW